MTETLESRTTAIVNEKPSLDHLEGLLGEMAGVVNELNTATVELEEQVTKLRAAVKPQFDTLTAEKDRILAQIREYCFRHRNALFGDMKTLKLLHGKVGYRTGPPRLDIQEELKEDPKGAWMTALQLLMSVEWGEGYVRRTPEIDKENLLAAAKGGQVTPEQLAELGLSLETYERFYVEVKQEDTPAR
jgi:phage host-nuclease inhibitor protein Gam